MKQMKHKINSINLTYKIKGESQKTILFLHGNSLSSDTFINQFSDKTLDGFKLIAPDFPGHGSSQRSTQPEEDYSVFGFRDVIIELVQELSLSNFIIAGHSLGGHVAIECLPYVENCKGLMSWGTPPISLPLNIDEIFYPHPDIPLFYKEQLSGYEISRLGMLVSGGVQQEMIHSVLTSTDPMFRTHLAQSLSRGELSDEIKILNSGEVPVAILHGGNDPCVKQDYLENLKLKNLYKQKVITIEKSGHSSQIECSLEFNHMLVEFANSVFKR